MFQAFFTISTLLPLQTLELQSFGPERLKMRHERGNSSWICFGAVAGLLEGPFEFIKFGGSLVFWVLFAEFAINILRNQSQKGFKIKATRDTQGTPSREEQRIARKEQAQMPERFKIKARADTQNQEIKSSRKKRRAEPKRPKQKQRETWFRLGPHWGPNVNICRNCEIETPKVTLIFIFEGWCVNLSWHAG